MRKLIYVPIIHSGADMGSMASDLNQRGIDEFGDEFWRAHVNTVNRYWEIVSQCCDTIDFEGKPVRIYQDGMVTDGEIAMRIVEDSVKAGSKNYEIVQRLIAKGATLEKTENLELVKKEVEMLKAFTSSGSLLVKVVKVLMFKARRAKLLVQRDRYIAGRIAETLRNDEVGLIFLGAYHNITDKLPGDIQVVELKKIDNVRSYQKSIPFHGKNKQQLEELRSYLISPCPAMH